MLVDGKSLDDYTLDSFCGPARIYAPTEPMTSDFGYIFIDQNIDTVIAGEIKRVKPRFVGLACEYEWDLEIEKDLLAAGVVQYEKLAHTAELPHEFEFYGVPLRIQGGDGSPVRAFAIVS
jgi:kynurenine formamidase